MFSVARVRVDLLKQKCRTFAHHICANVHNCSTSPLDIFIFKQTYRQLLTRKLLIQRSVS
ncbi:hypothetical protein T05_2964 [Trichinella murrelli]|uniref:Uncharacterized protein n=1 Tax=Trichinella murrelli TaxID=144512 RepID=A0A0V0TPG8_9BILA|nr:hypothetical protein T05_2964 [Trichinella murrelli]